MKKPAYLAALAVLTTVTAASPALAAPANLDQYGCRAESGTYRCYQGNNSGRSFTSQEDMLTQTNTRSNNAANTNRSTGTNSNIGSSSTTSPATQPNGTMGSSGSMGHTGTSATPSGNNTSGGRY